MSSPAFGSLEQLVPSNEVLSLIPVATYPTSISITSIIAITPETGWRQVRTTASAGFTRPSGRDLTLVGTS